MEFQQLLYFQSLAQTHNYTHTASQLHVTQPTVTTAIKNLESELNVKLISREGGVFALTPAGEELLWRSEIVIRNMQDILIQVPKIDQGKRQELHLGVPPMSASHLYPIILNDFSALHPEIDIQILDYCNAEVEDRLKHEEMDLGFLIIPEAEDTDLAYHPLSCGSLEIILSEKNPLSKKNALHIEDLIDQKILMYEKDTSYIEKRMARAFSECGIVWQIDQYYNNMITIYDLIAQNFGISFSMSSASPTLSHVSGIVSRPFACPIQYTLGLAWKKGRKHSAAADAFIGYLNKNPLMPSLCDDAQK